MTSLHHTVNIAAGLNIVVFDDRGQKVEEFIFPFALFFFCLSGWLYGWLRRTVFSLAEFGSIFLPGGWREDLRFMALAVRQLFQPNLEFAV